MGEFALGQSVPRFEEPRTNRGFLPSCRISAGNFRDFEDNASFWPSHNPAHTFLPAAFCGDEGRHSPRSDMGCRVEGLARPFLERGTVDISPVPSSSPAPNRT